MFKRKAYDNGVLPVSSPHPLAHWSRWLVLYRTPRNSASSRKNPSVRSAKPR